MIHTIRTVAILVLLGISISSIALAEKEQAGKDLFLGRWTGEVAGTYKRSDEAAETREADHWRILDLVISREPGGGFDLVGVAEIVVQEPKLTPKDEADLRFEAVMPRQRMLARIGGSLEPDDSSISLSIAEESRDAWDGMLEDCYLRAFSADDFSGDVPYIFVLDGIDPSTFHATKDRITISSADTTKWPGGFLVISHSGELRRVGMERCKKWDRISVTAIVSAETEEGSVTLPEGATVHTSSETVKIETPDDGCAELVLKDYVRIVAADGSEFEIVISKVLVGLISSSLYEGAVQVDVRKDGKHHTFFTPNAVVDAEKAEFTLEVSEDGTTIVATLDGDVELSDLKKKQTITVGKNQISIVGSDGSPCEALTVNPDQLHKWLE